MKSIDLRNTAKNLRHEGKSYAEVGKLLGVTRFAARNLANYKLKVNKKKSGRKNIISKRTSLSLKREISRLNQNKERINSPKLIRNLSLNVNERTVQRHLLKMEYKYVKAANQIILSKKHKQERIDMISTWFSSNHPWENTVFSDEKRFTFDGPDNWMTYVKKNSKYIRQKRQCHGGGIMLWLMTLPNGLLSYHSIIGSFKTHQYIALLRNYVVPTMKINLGNNFYFQQDNASVHTSKLAQQYLKDANVRTLMWPSKSPDLNIV